LISALIPVLPTDIENAIAESAIREITDEIGNNTKKLKIVVAIIYRKAMQDERWAATAISLFIYLCDAIPETMHVLNDEDVANEAPPSGPGLVRRYLHHFLQLDFESDMLGPYWSVPRLWFLAELPVFDADETINTPFCTSRRIKIDAAKKMAESVHLFNGLNLDLLLEFIHWVVPSVDEMPCNREELTAVLEGLSLRASGEQLMAQLLVSGLLRMRENSW
ncbi:hypothetical protein EJ02DRAFT_305966, partial [Clathrospora elynae]